MSSAVFPVLPGLAFPLQKKPITSTIIQTTASGRELRASSWRSPVFEWGLKYDVVRTGTHFGTAYTEYETLAGFFNARGGRRESFLFEDPSDHTTAATPFGEGDGVTTTFTLGRTISGGFVHVGAIHTITSVTIDGVATGAYTISGSRITFAAPPPKCAELAWTGTFYYRVRFRDDRTDFDYFMRSLWENRAIWIRQVKGVET